MSIMFINVRIWLHYVLSICDHLASFAFICFNDPLILYTCLHVLFALERFMIYIASFTDTDQASTVYYSY